MNYKTAILFVLLCFSTFLSISQTHPQLRLKLGIVKTFASPFVSEGFAYKNVSVNSPYPVLGLEFTKPVKNEHNNWFAGVSFDIQEFRSAPNLNNFDSYLNSGTIGLSLYTLRFYGGFEKKIGNKDIPANKNYFSFFGGLGLTFNKGPDLGPFGTGPAYGITKDGRQFISPANTNPFIPDPYLEQVYVGDGSFLSPTIFGGLRWHIRNKKGNDAMTVELLGNYGLTRYYNYKMPYTLDGVPYMDKMGEKGVCLQLNFLIPLKNFGKRKTRK